MSVPQLRFKDADGRDFPEWEEKFLGDLCSTFKSGLGITSEKIQEKGSYPVYGGNGLRGFTDTFTHDGFFVLIGRQGALCGNINRSHGKAYISEHAIAAQANQASDTEWLAQQLDLLRLNRLSESSAQPGLAVNKLVKLQLIVPTKPEQTKIANFLTAVDEKIAQLTHKCDLLVQYKKGVMQHIFSQKLCFKDDDGRDFPEWEETELRDLCDLITKGTTPTSVGHEFQPSGINFIKIESLQENGTLIKEKLGFINSDTHKKLLRSQLKLNDILFSIAGALGRVAIVTKDCLPANTNQALAIIRLRERKSLNTKYIFYALTNESIKKLIESISVQLAQANLSLKDIGDLIIPLPIYDEQTKIGNFLTAIDDKITTTQTQLKAVKLYKQGLLQQLFV